MQRTSEPCPAAPEPWSPRRCELTGPDGVLEHRLRTVLANKGSALSEWGDRFRPLLAWMEDAGQTEYPVSRSLSGTPNTLADLS